MTPLTPTERMRFVKVSVLDGDGRTSGYLTDVSIAMLLVELERGGFAIVKRRADGEAEANK